MYSDIVLDHFRNPRNVGSMEKADGVGEIKSQTSGDFMIIYIMVEHGYIRDIKFQTFGCAAAIAVSSMLTELVKGKSLEFAKNITKEVLADALGGLPEDKMDCSNLGSEALKTAIENYESKNK